MSHPPVCLILLLLLCSVDQGVEAPLPQGPYYKVYGNPIARPGQTVDMDCHLTKQTAIVGFLSSTEWVKDGKVMAGQISTRLTLYHVTRQDAGHYQCGEPGSDLHRMGLDLHVFVIGDVLPRPDVIQQYDGLAVLGRPYSLQCIIRGTTYIANEATVYTWYKDSVEVKGQTGAVLLLPNVTQADEGKYRCTAREGPVETTSPASFDFDLTVFVPPRVRIKPSGPVVRGILGENLTLTCEVTQAMPYVPKDGYSWSYLPSFLGEHRRLKKIGRTLTLGPLTLEDRGQYICQARNDQQFEITKMSGHASVTVDVVYLENITLLLDHEINENEYMILTCAVDSHPTARLAWTINGQDVRHVAGNLDHYVIMSAACSDSNNYTCHASNIEMRGKDRNATIRVKVPCMQADKKVEEPVLIPDKAETEVIATLHLSLAEMTSSMVVVHPAGHDVITVHQDCSFHVTPAFLSRCLQPRCDLERHHLTFALTQVTEEDEGDYTCVEEGTERPVPKCGTKLLNQKDTPQRDHQNLTTVAPLLSVAFVLIGILIGVALGTICNDNVRNLRKQLTKSQSRHLHEDDVPLEAWEFAKDREMRFENLYERGRIYVIPRMDSEKERDTVTSDEDSDNEEKQPLSRRNVSKKAEELKVKNLMILTLQVFSSASKDNLPSFVLHNTHLSKKDVILILDRYLGVIVMITKCITRLSQEKLSFVEVAGKRLLEARDIVRRKLQGLGKSRDVTAVLALPCLTHKQTNDVRKNVKILNSHVDLELLLGQDAQRYHQWMEGLRAKKASKVWRSSSRRGDDPDTVYKMAASRFLSLAGCGDPGESPPSPDPAQSWLLTPAQMEVRDSTARLLHVWGPPGSGKTMLVVQRARQWLADGNALVLSSGKQFYDVKLAHIEKGVRDENKENRMRLCRTNEELDRSVKQLGSEYPKLKICIITDNLCQDETLKTILSNAETKSKVYAWSTSEQNLCAINAELSNKATELGWESIKLPDCIRCTKDTVELLNLLGKDVYPPIPSCSLPHDPDIPAWRVVDHCLHPDPDSTLSCCSLCKTDMTEVLPSKGRELPWKEWIALYTGQDFTNFDPPHEALLHMEVPSTHCTNNYIRSVVSGIATEEDFQRFRELVHAGVDEGGKPTVHFLWIEDFKGMEREGVILVHYDDRDTDPRRQSQEERATRLEDHRVQWIHAVSRSKGQVILLLLTPSPARNLLHLPEPVMARK